jgi:CBS domain-containing protein
VPYSASAAALPAAANEDRRGRRRPEAEGETPMKIRDLRKSSPVSLQTISPDHTVHEAIQVLCRCNIGALPVVDADETLVGIVSERDVLRLCSRDDCASALTLKVRDVMTRDLVVGVLDDSVDYVMRVMTDRRVRHLPVLEGRRLVAIVSIGDVVKAQYDEKETEARFLRDYMQGALA